MMLAATSSHVATCPDLGPGCGTPAPPTPYWHHVALFTSDVFVDASYGLTSWLALDARLGLRVVDVNPTYEELDHTPKSVPNDPHHHDETLVGPTDPWLMLRAAGAWGRLVAAARVGVTLPIGSTVPNPYPLGERGLWHQHIQFGSGTVIPVVGLGLSYALPRVELDLSALGFFSLYENAKGFRAPSRFYPSLRVAFPFLNGALRPYTTVDLPYETPELWGGRMGLEGGSGARAQLLVGAGIAWKFQDPWQLDVGVRARVTSFTDTVGFDYPGVLSAAFSTRFDAGGKPKKHP